MSLLTSGLELWRPFAPACLGIAVAALLPGEEQVLATLAAQGLERSGPWPISFSRALP